MTYRFPRVSALVIIFALCDSNFAWSDKTSSSTVDVVIGKPSFVEYSRAFPLLDGLFQDEAAIQLSPLKLDTTTANSSSLDAVIQQYQLSLQYSQILGLQNSSAAQQTSQINAAYASQTQFITLQGQLLSQLALAQQQQLSAQKAVDALVNPSDDQLAQAQSAKKIADDNVSTINTQLSSIKNVVNITANPSFQTTSVPASTGLPSAPTLQTPTSIAPLPTTSTPSNLPTLPPSKLLENQSALLRERLAHLISTLNQQSEAANGNLYLAEFHTGFVNGKYRRKNMLFTTQYKLGCGARILDLYPRNAAVNIADEKYRDSKTGLSLLLSFFSVGVNTAYNREHLQITQALDQAAYTTGYGIGTDTFGWIFGAMLGEDTIAPGDRQTFALISLPKGGGSCRAGESPKLSFEAGLWGKSPILSGEGTSSEGVREDWYQVAVRAPGEASASDAQKSPSVQGYEAAKSKQTTSYSPVVFDPAVPATKQNTVVNLSWPADNFSIDSEATITVNGIALQRARDTFGRGTASSGPANSIPGSGGLLETSTSFNGAGTWIPINSHQLSINLDPSLFLDGFPQIEMCFPGQTPLDLTEGIDSASKINIAGQTFTCPANTSCRDAMPPLSHKDFGTPVQLAVVRYEKNTKLSINTIDTLASPGSASSTQLVTAIPDQVWSQSARAMLATTTNDHFLLSCTPYGQQLSCQLPDGVDKNQFTIRVEDKDHLTTLGKTSIMGTRLVPSCDGPSCEPKVVNSIGNPIWNGRDGWKLNLGLLNADTGEDFYVFLHSQAGGVLGQSRNFSCPSGSGQCPAWFEVKANDFPELADEMCLHVSDREKDQGAPCGVDDTRITNIRKATSPILYAISDDFTALFGVNLAFDYLQVGADTTHRFRLTCNADRTICSADFNDYSKKGYVSFVTGKKLGDLYPLIELTTATNTLNLISPFPGKTPPSGASNGRKSVATAATPATGDHATPTSSSHTPGIPYSNPQLHVSEKSLTTTKRLDIPDTANSYVVGAEKKQQ